MTERFTIAQVAAQLGISERCVRNYISQGLRVERVNKRVLRITEEDLAEFMRRNEPRVKEIQSLRRVR